jgi:hypothetical protein
MKTIKEFILSTKMQQTLSIKGLEKILSVKLNHKSIILYAIVDNENDFFKKVNFLIVANNEDINKVYNNTFYFLDTLTREDIIFHVFYKDI